MYAKLPLLDIVMWLLVFVLCTKNKCTKQMLIEALAKRNKNRGWENKKHGKHIKKRPEVIGDETSRCAKGLK